MSNPTGKNADSLICPRCTGFIPDDQTPGAYPGALSRTDNETEVCSSCGTREGMEALVNGQVMAQELWACNRDTTHDWKGPDFRMNEMINTHPDREALIAFLKDSNRSGTEEDFDVFKNSFLGMWSSVEEGNGCPRGSISIASQLHRIRQTRIRADAHGDLHNPYREWRPLGVSLLMVLVACGGVGQEHPDLRRQGVDLEKGPTHV